MIIERPLLGHVDIQTPDYRAMGFTLGLSRLGDLLGDGTTGQVWRSLIHDATELQIKRGFIRSGLGLRTDVGLMTFTIQDSDPLHGGEFQPGQHVRAVALIGDEPRPLFTGKVADISGAYPLNKSTGELRPRTTITVADAVSIHTQTPRYGAKPPAGLETFEERIARLESSSRSPIEVPPLADPREVYAF